MSSKYTSTMAQKHPFPSLNDNFPFFPLSFFLSPVTSFDFIPSCLLSLTFHGAV
jgi:hypothetical protein